jgi:hypothetical protein
MVDSVEHRARVRAALRDELVRVAEVRRLHAERAGRREHDDVRAGIEGFELRGETVPDQQMGRVEEHRQRTARRLVELTGGARGKHVHAVRAQLERVTERGVVGHSSVHEQTPLVLDGRQDAGDRSACQHRVDERPAGNAHLVAGHHIGRDDVQGDPRLLDQLDGRVPLQQTSQTGIGHEVAPRAEQPKCTAQRVEREDLAAMQSAPDVRELVRGLDRLGTLGDEGTVECTGRGPDDEIGHDSPLVEGLKHAHLDRPETGAA